MLPNSTKKYKNPQHHTALGIYCMAIAPHHIKILKKAAAKNQGKNLNTHTSKKGNYQ